MESFAPSILHETRGCRGVGVAPMKDPTQKIHMSSQANPCCRLWWPKTPSKVDAGSVDGDGCQMNQEHCTIDGTQALHDHVEHGSG